MGFAETFHWHVVGDALDGLIGGAAPEIWHRLQVLAVYLLNRPNHGTIGREDWQLLHDGMESNARSLARLLEQQGVDHMLTISLHVVICRAFKQEMEVGPSGGWRELFVEREVLWMKSRTKYKASARLPGRC